MKLVEIHKCLHIYSTCMFEQNTQADACSICVFTWRCTQAQFHAKCFHTSTNMHKHGLLHTVGGSQSCGSIKHEYISSTGWSISPSSSSLMFFKQSENSGKHESLRSAGGSSSSNKEPEEPRRLLIYFFIFFSNASSSFVSALVQLSHPLPLSQLHQ